MSYIEKDIEDYIYEEGCIFYKGICIVIVGRQVNIGNGYIDLVGVDNENTNNIYVIEIKKNKINRDAYFQLLKYMKDINLYIKKEKQNIYGLLIGSGISEEILYALNNSYKIFYLEYNHIFKFYDEKNIENINETTKKQFETFQNMVNGE